MNALLAASVATAALAGLLFGFDTAVIAGVTQDLVRVYALGPGALGITVSAALWGTLVGALTAGVPGDRWGSRRVLTVLAAFYFVTGVGCALASDWGLFLALRFTCGLAIGGSSVLAPVYIAEIAPPARRGMLVGCFQLMIVVGILLAYLSNALIAGSGVTEAWRWKLGVSAAPALVLIGLLVLIPDSPRWLIGKGRVPDAARALRRIGVADAEAEIEAIRRSLAAAGREERLSWRGHRRPIVLAVLIAAFNQFAGINAVLYYLNDIFAEVGVRSPDRQAVAVGAVNLLFTLIGLTLIDRVGRRPLLAAGAAGMAACLAAVALALAGWVTSATLLPALLGFIACFAISQGAVIWVYLSEIFPTPVRARGSALGASTHWGLNAAIAAVFPSIAALSAAAPFAIFAGCMVVQCIVVLTIFPETKRATLEMVSAHMEATP